MDKNKVKRYLAAVSGGPDSMAMLDRYKKQIKVVAHVNYHKRLDSDHDEKIVREYCQKNNLILAVYQVSAKDYQKYQNNNFQTLARFIRYDFFQALVKKYQLDGVMIAHQLDDFLETALMQKKRHSKNYFYGIKRQNMINQVFVVRPLITWPKNKLLKYCQKHYLEYALDSSNEQDVYERNRIRHQWQKRSNFYKRLVFYYFCLRNFFKNIEQKKVQDLYLQWGATNFCYRNFDATYKKYGNSLIYLFLKQNSIKTITSSKINAIVSYLNSFDARKVFRLSDTQCLKKKNKCLLFITDNE